MSTTLTELGRRPAEHPVTMQELLDVLGPQSHAITILVFTIPFLQPIPLPGLSTVFGLAIMTTAAALGLGKPPWIPRRCRGLEIPGHALSKICEKGIILFRFLERFIHPRGRWFHQSLKMKRMAALSIMFAAALLSLPLPIPGTNMVPAVTILLLTLGLLEEDGYVVAAGYVAFGATLIIFSALLSVPLFGIHFINSSH